MAAEKPPLVCPRGCGELDVRNRGLCQVCGFDFGCGKPYLDFAGNTEQSPSGVGPRLMHSKTLARVYERVWRPMFVSVLGAGPANIEREFTNVRRALSTARGDWVVDLSCGPGVLGRRMARCGDFKGVVGLDLSHPMLKQAAHYTMREATPDFVLIRADVVNQPFPTGGLGGAHAGAALHLWPDVRGALREIARTLRPGAPFVATTFFTARSRMISLGQRMVGNSITTRFFEEEWLRHELHLAGFRDVSVKRRAAYGFLQAFRA